MKNTTKEKLISLAGLTERGWTKTMVEKMNLQVVKTVPNPHHKSAPPMKLYDLKTVKRKEKNKTFQLLAEKANKRKMSAKKAVETKMNKMNEYLLNLKIKIPNTNKENILLQSVRQHNQIQDHYQNYDSCINEKDIENVDTKRQIRIVANYIRHQMTDYEEILYDNTGKTGIHHAHDFLKEKITNMVIEKYFNEYANIYTAKDIYA